MANIHRYLQSPDSKTDIFFLQFRLIQWWTVDSCWCSSRYVRTKMAYKIVHKQTQTGKKTKTVRTLMAIGMERRPNYPLIGIDVPSIRNPECVDRTHTIDKYATLDRISLMHSNNHKLTRLSIRNLLNGPFPHRSM